MRQGDFVEKRQGDWQRLSGLLDRIGSMRLHGLMYSELVEIRVLYRRVAGDLAFAQTRLADPKLEYYLNDLVARGHALLYSPPKRSWRAGAREMFFAGAEALRRRMGYVLLSIALFTAGTLFGALAVYVEPSWTLALIPEQFRSSLDAWKSAKTDEGTGAQHIAMTAFLNLNNSRVTLIMFGTGLFWGIVPAFMLIYNGMLMGAFVTETARAGTLFHFVSGVLLHGVAELSAIFFAGAGGFLLGRAMIAPGEVTRVEALRKCGTDAFWLLAVALVLLVEAAIVEANFSHSALSGWVKLSFAAVSLLVLLGYVYGVRRPDEI